MANSMPLVLTSVPLTIYFCGCVAVLQRYRHCLFWLTILQQLRS